MAENNHLEETYDDGIDLSSIFAVLWNRKKLIILGTLGATLVSIGVSLLLPKVYRSEGFFQLGNPTKKIAEDEKSAKKMTASVSVAKKTSSIGIPVPLYKSTSSQFFNPNRFQLKALQDKSFGEEELIKIRNSFRSSADINKWIKPVYAFAKEDAREFSQLPQDESNSVLGLNMAYETDSPKNAAAYVDFFGNYIRDCLLYVSLYNYVMDGYSNTRGALNKNENDIIRLQFELLQNTNKKKDIQAILSNYPEAAKMESRQIVSVQEGGSRFLAPVTQLVGIESTLAELRQEIAELDREQGKLSVREEYFSRCFNEIKTFGKNGESLYMMLKSVKNEVFKNRDLSHDDIKEVFNNLSIDLQAFDFAFYQNSRFISGPTIPTEHIKPRKSIIISVTFVGSFFFFIILAFIVNWWQGNKKSIMNDSYA
jgi:LPS O-antigen subunit length determinant protein (WzzB/FepE family)